MGQTTGIAWCHHTFNMWWGCTKITSACKYCYAEMLAKRTRRIPEGYIVGSKRILSKTHNLSMLLKWDKAAREAGEMRRVFFHSMSDVFDEAVPDEWRVQEFEWIQKTTNLWPLILTKRSTSPMLFLARHPEFISFFINRVWLGTSLGSNDDMDMAYQITAAPARVHWVSYEPAIGPLSLRGLPESIRWVVIGGESGSKRKFELEWGLNIIRDREQNKLLKNKSIYVKQMGANPILNGQSYATPSDKSHGAIPDDWPEELRVREYPLE